MATVAFRFFSSRTRGELYPDARHWLPDATGATQRRPCGCHGPINRLPEQALATHYENNCVKAASCIFSRKMSNCHAGTIDALCSQVDVRRARPVNAQFVALLKCWIDIVFSDLLSPGIYYHAHQMARTAATVFLCAACNVPGATATWTIAALSTSCETHCTDNGWSCSTATLLSRNSEVDTSAEVEAILTAAGVSSTFPCVSSNTINSPTRAPQYKGSECSYSDPSKTAESDYSCTRTPGNNQRRLCYCDGADSPSPSPPPPPPSPSPPPPSPSPPPPSPSPPPPSPSPPPSSSTVTLILDSYACDTQVNPTSPATLAARCSLACHFRLTIPSPPISLPEQKSWHGIRLCSSVRRGGGSGL